MSWNEVGTWIKDNAGSGVKLIGSLLLGNAPGAIAAGVSLVSSATGTSDPGEALAALQNPEVMVRLKELYYQEEQSVREHIRAMSELEIKSQQTTQDTIRAGDAAEDPYIRHTRPKMAKQSWTATVAYCVGCFGVYAITRENLFDVYLAGFLATPAAAYLGLRTGDKFAAALGKSKKGGSIA
jgi:hypothetical protein